MSVKSYKLQLLLAGLLLWFSVSGMAEGFNRECLEGNSHYLRLSSVASVANEKIYLRDLLIGSDAPEFLHNVGEVLLGEFDGYTERRLKRFSVEQKVNKLSGAHCVNFLGPESILIRRQKADGVNLEKVSLGAASFLKSEIQTRFDTKDLSLSLLKRKQAEVISNVPENANLQFRWASSEKLSTTEFVWVDWKDVDRLLLSLPIQIAVSGSVSVQVMSVEVSKYNRVFEKHVTTAFVPITNRPVSAVFDLGFKDPKRYVRNLNVGHVLSAKDIEPLPAVVMGGFVTLQANSQQVSIKALMVAMHDGSIGDVVRLSSPTSKDYIKAKVIGRNLALAIN